MTQYTASSFEKLQEIKIQRELMDASHQVVYKRLSTAPPRNDRTPVNVSLPYRMQALVREGASSWLGIPSQEVFRMAPHDFVTAMNLRLGAPLVSTHGNAPPIHCRCQDRSIVDSRGLHIRSCKKGAGRLQIGRHDIIQHLGAEMHRSVGHIVTTNDTHVVAGRNMDIVVHWPHQLAVDVGVVDPSLIGHKTAAAYAQSKLHEVSPEYVAAGFGFVPFVFETTGGMSAGVLENIRRVAQDAAALRGIPASVVASFWKKAFSFRLQTAFARTMRFAMENAGHVKEDRRVPYMPPVAQQLELEVLARATGEWPGIDPDARARASRRGVFSR